MVILQKSAAVVSILEIKVPASNLYIANATDAF